MSTYTTQEDNQPLYFVLTLLAAVTGWFFFAEGWLVFYVVFELSLIPIFLIILGWGYQRERLKASKALVFYTISGSIPLILILSIIANFGCSHIFQVSQSTRDRDLVQLIMLAATTGFLVKLPICCLHIWLPKAHVEAPVYGSIFLAAVLLKIGGWGLIKVAPHVSNLSGWLSLLAGVSLWGLIIINLICIQSSDLKVLIAFSSVRHIGIAFLSLRSGTQRGFNAMLMIILGHGIRSSLMFFYSYLFYVNSATRSLLLNKTLKVKAGLIAVLWGVSCVGMIGGPPTINLWFEVRAFLCILRTLGARAKFLFWRVFLTGVYTLICLRSVYSGNQVYNQVNFALLKPVRALNILYHSVFLFRLCFLFFSL